MALIASVHGSRLVLGYLLEEGIDTQVVERAWPPAGLDLGAANPEEIALSIMSQIVALRRGGSVLSLKQKNEISSNKTAGESLTTHDDTPTGDHSSQTSATDKVIRQCETT